MAKYSEQAFIPMCTPEKGKPWFAPNAMRWHAKDARDAFIDICYGPTVPLDGWKALKLEGWRIVKVKVSET